VTSRINWSLFTQSLDYELTILGDIVQLLIAYNCPVYYNINNQLVTIITVY